MAQHKARWPLAFSWSSLSKVGGCFGVVSFVLVVIFVLHVNQLW